MYVPSALQNQQDIVDCVIGPSDSDKHIFRGANRSRRPASHLARVPWHVHIRDFISYFLRLLGYSHGCEHGCNVPR